LIASGSFDGTVTLWDTGSAQPLEPLALPGPDRVSSVAVAADHSAVLAGGRDSGRAYLFDLVERKDRRVLDCRGAGWTDGSVDAVAFAPDGASLATGTGNNVRLWSTATVTLLREISGWQARIQALAFSPDGQILASVDADGVLRLWNPATGERVNSTAAHIRNCWGISFSRDSKRIATVGREDFTAKIWDAQTLALHKTICLTNRTSILASLARN
jgi:WD40 repeat protein